MQFTVHNVRSIRSADITIEDLTLVCGPNLAGKTTLLNTAAALMLGDRQLYGATQKDAQSVVSEGADIASARIVAAAAGGDMPDWSTGMIWPKCDHTENGERPPANAVTMGKINPVADFDAKQWAGFVRSIAGGGGITSQQISEEIEATCGKGDARIGEVLDTLKQGWDAVTKLCDDRRNSARKAWEGATGEKFGTTKAKGWRHESDVNGADPAELGKRLAALEEEHSRALVSEELGTRNADELHKLMMTQGEQSNRIGGKLAKLRTEIAETQHELSFFPHSDPLNCPCCGVVLELKGGTLSEHKAGAYVRNSDAHKALIEQLDDQQAMEKKITAERGTICAELRANESVLARLKAAAATSRAKQDVHAELVTVRQMLAAAEATAKAGAAWRDWSFWKAAGDVVGPTGLRLQATVKALKELNPRLAAIARMIFPGHEVALVHDEAANTVALMYDGKPYQQLVWGADPNSYELRAKALFQLLEAQRLGDGAWIIIDRFDTLEKTHKNGLFKAIMALGITALIGQMMSDKPEKDTLAAAGVGRTYWIDSGTVRAV